MQQFPPEAPSCDRRLSFVKRCVFQPEKPQKRTKKFRKPQKLHLGGVLKIWIPFETSDDFSKEFVLKLHFFETVVNSAPRASTFAKQLSTLKAFKVSNSFAKMTHPARISLQFHIFTRFKVPCFNPPS